jgi:hypothetical protein
MLQLICVFCTEPTLEVLTTKINKTYEIVSKRIFVLSIEDSEELVCSFNVEKGNISYQLPNSMLVHRKKETNTMYTINSLNQLICMENNGRFVPGYSIEWNRYRNSFLLTSNNELKIHRTSIFRVISF